jgi:hypothetical protein
MAYAWTPGARKQLVRRFNEEQTAVRNAVDGFDLDDHERQLTILSSLLGVKSTDELDPADPIDELDPLFGLDPIDELDD